MNTTNDSTTSTAMKIDTTDTTDAVLIAATLIAEDARLDFLPNLFGARLMMRAETLLFNWMGRLCTDYRGGYWLFYSLSNGGAYLAPKAGRMRVQVHTNGFAGEMSADAAGIVATLFTLCQLAEETELDEIIQFFHDLRDFGAEHAESSLICSAID